MIAELIFLVVAVALALPGLVVPVFELGSYDPTPPIASRFGTRSAVNTARKACPRSGRRRDVNFQQVQYFLAVCEARSFTRAARRCGVAQPTVTKAIRELEGQIGGPLFVRRRHRGGRSPTSLGLAIKPYFGRAIRSLKRAERSPHV